MNDKSKIKDFGEKIGGARKDLFKESLTIDDLQYMNEVEKRTYVTKRNIWKDINYQKLVDEGLSNRVAFFMKTIKDAVPTKAQNNNEEIYINFVTKIRDFTMQLKTEEDILNFYDDFMKDYLIKKNNYKVEVKDTAKGCINNKLLKAAHVSSLSRIDNEIKKKEFCFSIEDKILKDYEIIKYSKENMFFDKDNISKKTRFTISTQNSKAFYYPEKIEKLKDNTYFILKERDFYAIDFNSLEEAQEFILKNNELKKEEIKNKKNNKKKRKKPFKFKKLDIKYFGPDYRKGKNITGEDFLNDFELKGGEFGNYLNDSERQEALNYAYEALHSLADALNIDSKDISLGSRLSIAFGARGFSSALAHYEPMREVINLTKKQGAGSLAHEFAHALDDIINKELSETDIDLTKKRNLPEIHKNLINSMKYKEVQREVYAKDKEQEIKNKIDFIDRYISQFLPKEYDLSEEDFKEMNELKKAVIEDKIKDIGNYVNFGRIKGNTVQSIENLSAFVKKITRKSIPLKEKANISSIMYDLNSLKENKNKTIETAIVHTDFYKNSIIFDKEYTKDNKGYWSSDVEMFARAFACYIEDKCKEINIRSDYLTAHASLAQIETDDKIIRAYPYNEERKNINENFDKLIDFYKEKGLLNDKDVNKQNSFTFDNIICNAKEKKNSACIDVDSKQKENVR